MKFSKLLVLGALLLIGSSASAELVNGVRQRPVPANMQGFTASPDTETYYYLYNTQAKMFFMEGNAWGTQASVDGKGLKVAFTLYEGGEAYLFNDFSVTKNAWMLVFFDSETQMYVDRNGQANYGWAVEEHGSTFRLHVADDPIINPTLNWMSYPNLYVGLDVTESANNTALSPFLSEGEGHYIDWALVAEADYEAYLPLLEIYLKAQELKDAIDAAEAQGVDVSGPKAVYENESSTMEELEAAIQAVKEAVLAAAQDNASVANPMDMTGSIVNPKYEGSSNGWSGTAPDLEHNVAEFYNKTYDMYQKLTTMPRGVYGLKVKGYYRDGGFSGGAYDNFLKGQDAKNALMYATASEETFTTPLMSIYAGAVEDSYGNGTEVTVTSADGKTVYIPNMRESAEIYMNDNRYNDNLLVFGTNDTEFNIGLKKTVSLGSDWTCFVGWELVYYGSKADAYQLWVQNLVKNPRDVDNFTYYTTAVNEAYKAAVAAALGASTYEEVVAAVKNIEEASQAVDDNQAAWATYNEAVAYAINIAANPQLDLDDERFDDFVDYMDEGFDGMNYRKFQQDHTKTTEEVLAEAQRLREMAEYAAKNAIKENTDVTDMYLINPRYEEGTKGWEGSPVIGGPANNRCAEAYDRANFDIYQVVKEAPLGVYEISLQGFFRLQRDQTAYDLYNQGGQICPVWVYVNNNNSEFKCVFDEPVAVNTVYTEGAWAPSDSINWYPNTMVSAGQAFSAGMYVSSAFGIVAKEGGELRLGVKGDLTGPNWAIWDNFRMVYKGFNADAIRPELQKAIAELQAFADADMPQTTIDEVNNAIAAGNAALAGNDGKTMFDALAALYDARDNANASIALYEKLRSALANLGAAMLTADCAPATMEAASALFDEVEAGLANKSITNEQVPEYLKRISEMRILLMGEASDAHPVNVTAVMTCPNFNDEDGNDSQAGWAGTLGAFAQTANTGTPAVEFYQTSNVDIYQDVEGLPAGIYEIKCSAMCRLGYSADDYKAYIANPDSSSAYLYGMTNDVISSVPIKALASGAVAEDPGIDGQTTVTADDGTVLYEPNTMLSFLSWCDFDEQPYQNSVFVRVDNGKLRIGVKKPGTYVAGDWLIMDNFRLYYYGENSAIQPNGDAEGIDEAQTVSTVKVEIYTLNGARAQSLQKGVNIVKQTMSDGSVKIQKILVK